MAAFSGLYRNAKPSCEFIDKTDEKADTYCRYAAEFLHYGPIDEKHVSKVYKFRVDEEDVKWVEANSNKFIMTPPP